MPPFVVFAMPRSRSVWLSHFLNYGEWRCWHDELLFCDTLEDVRFRLVVPCSGYVETAAAPFWRLLEAYAPGARIVTLRRPIPAVMASLTRAGMAYEPVAMERGLRALERRLDQIERQLPDVLALRFDDLTDEETCAEVFEHCLPYAHDPEWWREMDRTNVQLSMRWFAGIWIERQVAFKNLAQLARRELLEA